ncbi:MAG TPA: methyltransferase domain-containing protein [Bryobacteraceae bacterium]|jgi:ubiquinone/menaquinone biosynthesis C-methylase UbiE|nr:methyltransferase domain-containing protein [Bryobacteraceae bacterium]
MAGSHYIIRGGVEGRERLRILARVMQSSTHSLLHRAGIRPGMSCLEIGCGGGDLAFDMARMVGPAGRVVGTDIDEAKLGLARKESAELQLNNIDFQFQDITTTDPEGEFDLIHARFVLTHLMDPAQALTRMRRALRKGGVVVVEDIDFRGYFCYPESPAFWRYVELYTETVRRRGADPSIGPRLPSLLADAGFSDVQMNIVQPAGTKGEVKLLTPLTMENIADAVVAEGLADVEEIEGLVTRLYEHARTDGTIGCTPRIVEAWGRQQS